MSATLRWLRVVPAILHVMMWVRARICSKTLTSLGACLQRKDELLLSEHFSEGVRCARRAGGQTAALRVVNLDWHGMTKDLQESGAVEGLWAQLAPIAQQVEYMPCAYHKGQKHRPTWPCLYGD